MKPQKLQKIQDAALSVDLNGSAADKVQEHDLQMLFETTPVEELLKPMKGNSRKYRKYIIQLGKLDKRSPRVREKIVPFAVELYKEGDRIYRDIAACTFQIFLGQVCRNVQQIVGKDPEDIKKISKYSPEAMADLLLKYERICQNKKEPFRPNALWMVLDMAEMPYPEGKQHQAEALLKKKEKEAREARENKATKESKESKESKETKNGKGAKGERENKETREAAAPAEGPQEEPAARKNRNSWTRDKAVRTRNGRGKKKAVPEPALEAAPAEAPAPSAPEALGTPVPAPAPEVPMAPSAPEPQPAPAALAEPAAPAAVPAEGSGTPEAKPFTTYVGRINIVDSFYNFTPMGLWQEGQYRPLSSQEIDALIPKAEQYKNINLWYSLHSDQKYMEEHFHENDIIFLKIGPDTLVENKDGQGNLRSTAYRVFCIDALKEGLLEYPYQEGIYTAVPEKRLLDPISKDTVLRLQEENLFAGEQILIQLQDGWIAGPYEVQKNNRVGFFVENAVPANQYLLTACPPEAWQPVVFTPAEGTWASRQEKTEWIFYHRLPGTASQLVDRAPDEVLLRSLVKSAQVDSGDMVKPEILKNFLEREQGQLFSNLPSAIRKQRIQRLEAILEGDKAAREGYGQVGDFLYQHLLENVDKRWGQEFITALLERYPDIWQELGNAKGVSARNKKALALVQERQNRQAPPQTEEELAERINGIPASGSNNRKCLEYLIASIQKERPQYSRNLILNLLICATQGFLTVFSGSPGSGKTSFCNLLGKVLGLTQFERKIGPQEFMSTTNRYIPVSVERGWTSKRDLIGYYNPLTKAFEESNRDVYDGLRLLDWEKRHGIRQYPYYILLDEANLSPMEYYWADFMNVCDDWNEEHTLNLGHNHRFQLPETLHFLATINNDHTTETLSPRLIDRAWIVTLPHTEFVPKVDGGLANGEIQQISWQQLKSLFDVAPRESCQLSSVEQNVYDRVKARLAEQNIYLSMRIELALHRYWRVASRLMEPEDHIRPGIIALDYAVAQKVLPKLSGNGAEFEKWLVQFRDDCASNRMVQSAALLDQILEWGNRRMKFFQFFH
ncbi:hypothetical protein ACTUHY_10530 [Acidaminococcus sp. LBK-2]|uniref:hypothetical protein n=1 Tax=Acidaminococcus sp. LBK-2 TaxID=3456956 RepID=UPI003FA48087